MTPPPPESFQALHIIETLRSGVPSRRVSARFPHGRERILERVSADMARTAAGGSPSGLVISGSYGQGKSHLVDLMAELGRSQNFAVARVAVSKEAPFNQLAKLYAKLAASVLCPDADVAGLEWRFEKLRASAPETQALLQFTESNLHPRILVSLKGYFGSTDGEYRAMFLGDLTGDYLTAPTLRYLVHQSLGYSVQQPRLNPADYADYFRFLASAVQSFGYAGLLLLFDEMELIRSLSLRGRSLTYAHIGGLLGLTGTLALPHTYSALFFASSFFSDVVMEGNELYRIAESTARYPVPPEVGDPAGSLRHIVREKQDLASLNHSEMGAVLDQIEMLHGMAYGWTAQLDRELVLRKTIDAPLRTTLRGAIEFLDVLYQYGNAPSLVFADLDEGAIRAEDENDVGDEVTGENQ